MTLTWNNSTSWATSAMDETSEPEKVPSGGNLKEVAYRFRKADRTTDERTGNHR